MPTATPKVTYADAPNTCASCPMYDEYSLRPCGEVCLHNNHYVRQLTADERVTSAKLIDAAGEYTALIAELSGLACAVNANHRDKVRSRIIVLASMLGLGRKPTERAMLRAEKTGTCLKELDERVC